MKLLERISIPVERSARWIEADEREVTVMTRADAIDLYFGRREIHAVSVSPRIAVRLAWFLLSWWVWSCWAGIRPALWRWALRERLEEKRHDRRQTAPRDLPRRHVTRGP